MTTTVDAKKMRALRVRMLDDRKHAGYAWRSSLTCTLYRHDGRTWKMFYEGRWHVCHDVRDNVAAYTLNASDGEVFMRVARL